MADVWDDDLEALFASDLTAALGYRAPAGGVVVRAVAPIGLHDRERRTLGFITWLAFSKKLEVGDHWAVYAPHTETGYQTPANKTVQLQINGALAKQGVRASGTPDP